MKKGITRVNLGCIACLGLMLILLVLQFTPFWTYGEAGEMASISQYIWFPYKFTGVTAALTAALGEGFAVTQVVLWPAVVLVGCAVGTVLCLLKQHKLYTPIVAALAGLAGTIGYLFTPALKLGQGWGVHLLLSVLLLLLGCVTTWWHLHTK